MVDAEKFKTLQKYHTFSPKDQGTGICIKPHFWGFCYEGCPWIHKCRD
jgi:hypothetical protein